MEISYRTIRSDRGPVPIGRREKIAHWNTGSRLAVGVLAALAFVWPVSLLLLHTWTSAPLSWQSFLTAAPFAWFVFHTMLVFLFGSLVVQNPRIYGLRTLWIVGLIFMPPLAVPAYWWMHVWNAPFLNDIQEEDELTGSPKGLTNR